MKIRKCTFCRKFNWGTYWNFYHNDVLIVTSLVLRTQSVSPVFCPAALFYNSQVLNSNASYREKRTSSVSKHQTLTFHFSTYRPNSFIIYPIKHQSDCMTESTAAIQLLQALD